MGELILHKPQGSQWPHELPTRGELPTALETGGLVGTQWAPAPLESPKQKPIGPKADQGDQDVSSEHVPQPHRTLPPTPTWVLP